MEITNIILLSIKYTIPNELFNTISLMFTQKLGQWCMKRMSGN